MDGSVCSIKMRGNNCSGNKNVLSDGLVCKYTLLFNTRKKHTNEKYFIKPLHLKWSKSREPTRLCLLFKKTNLFSLFVGPKINLNSNFCISFVIKHAWKEVTLLAHYIKFIYFSLTNHIRKLLYVGTYKSILKGFFKKQKQNSTKIVVANTKISCDTNIMKVLYDKMQKKKYKIKHKSVYYIFFLFYVIFYVLVHFYKKRAVF